MNFRKSVGALFFISFSQLSIAQAATDSIEINELQEVIVTGTRTERAIATLPLPTQIITGGSIKKLGLSRLNEIIQEQTGLLTVPDFGGGEGIQMQGLDAAYVMILIDGQPLLGRSAGTLDLSRISINNIERIEIVKGASSSLYGSEALAGVVNIITKNPSVADKIQGNVNYKLATFNTHDVSATFGYGRKKVGVELFANYFKTDGYDLSDDDFLQTVEPYHNVTVQPKVTISFSDRMNLSVNSRLYKQNQNYKAEIETDVYSGESKIDEWNNSILLNQTISDHFKLVYDLYATNYKAHEYLNGQNNQPFEESKFNQWYYRPEIRSHYKVGTNTLSTGVGLNYETLDRTYFENKTTLTSEYIFSQFEWFGKEKWNILAGFRYDHHHQYQSQFSPKMGINYKWNDHFSLKASVGYGYKAPDLRQLYFDFTNSAVGYTVLGYNVAEEKLALLQSQGQILVNNGFSFSDPLKPESSVNFNFGGHYEKDKWSFDYNFFYNTIKNLIDTRAIAQKTNGQNVFSYFNIDRIFTYGLEVNSTYKANSNFSVSVGYQYLIAKDQTVVEKIERGEVFARDPVTLSSFQLKPSDYFGLYNRSAHTANSKISYLIPAIKASVDARVFYRSKYGVFDTNNNAILDKYDDFVKGYFLTNLTVNKDFKQRISAQVGVLNLLDYKDENNIPNLAGRQVFARLYYQF
ncbi:MULTISPECIES: TonB-dependent siderophore receptor [unclassified Flavobacterium]|uniref:TonB-dependent receptor plug domain-containing protein n=1 Tax=unclassified Flavobacterium TaxID=196869 RepID=UPI001F12929C|nr:MULTISPECIES: TonB-dependent receptor [unclassified Flavobacterium]UMY65439.1 TonB-dependent receptor [Flavobacterium sp. HJ-32-4]